MRRDIPQPGTKTYGKLQSQSPYTVKQLLGKISDLSQDFLLDFGYIPNNDMPSVDSAYSLHVNGWDAPQHTT